MIIYLPGRISASTQNHMFIIFVLHICGWAWFYGKYTHWVILEYSSTPGSRYFNVIASAFIFDGLGWVLNCLRIMSWEFCVGSYEIGEIVNRSLKKSCDSETLKKYVMLNLGQSSQDTCKIAKTVWFLCCAIFSTKPKPDTISRRMIFTCLEIGQSFA